MNASLAADASSSVPARTGVGPTRRRRRARRLGLGDKSMTAMPSAVGNAPARRIHVGPCQQRRYLQIAEIALQLVGGKVRIEGNADRRRGDRDDRHRRLGAARQNHRHPVAPAYAEPSQLPNCVVGPPPKLAIRYRWNVGRQKGLVVGGRPRMVRKELSEAQKDLIFGPLAARLVNNLGQVRTFLLNLSYCSRTF